MWINFDPNSNLPITRQLYDKIKEMILDAKLTPKDKLPSTRVLAGELKISRNTVLEVYNKLIAEGYLEARHGSGTIVSDSITMLQKQIREHTNDNRVKNISKEEKLINFRSGVPDLNLFPRKEWGRLYQRLCKDLPSSALRYQSPCGVYELREAISNYLYRTRGISCAAQNIMIVSGSTQGLSLISSLLYRDQQEVITEDPLHPGLLQVITSAGYHIKGIPVDEKGMITDLLAPSEHLSFLYTTPSHQYPMGGILPLQRRIALIQYAVSQNCYIIEDDYDSEFRFEGQPTNSLYELNPSKVIYLGSFSKILAPAIRIGFLILPKELQDQYKTLKMYSDVHTEALSQYTLAEFIQNGDLEKHIWRMKKLYNHKREHLIKELKMNFDGQYEILGQAAGLHIVIKFNNIIFTEELIKKLTIYHVKIYPVEDYTIRKSGRYSNQIILGYAHLTFTEITEGVKILRDVIKNLT